MCTSKIHQNNYKGLHRGQPLWKFCDIRPHRHTSYQSWHLSVQDPCGPDLSPGMAPALSLGNMGPVSDFNHDLGPTVTVLNQRMQQGFTSIRWYLMWFQQTLRYWFKAPKLVSDCGLDYTAVDLRMFATACFQASGENRAAMSLFEWRLAQQDDPWLTKRKKNVFLPKQDNQAVWKFSTFQLVHVICFGWTSQFLAG